MSDTSSPAPNPTAPQPANPQPVSPQPVSKVALGDLASLVGTTLGRAGINISDMDVGRSPSGVAALMVLSTDRALSAEVHAELSAAEGILHVATVDQE